MIGVKIKRKNSFALSYANWRDISLGGLSAAVILIIINVIKVQHKKDKTPEIDERTRKNITTFYAYSSHIF